MRRRLILATVLLVLPISALSVAWAGTASASTGVTCTKLTANVSKANGTISDCSDTANTGGKGTFAVATLASGSGTVTWNGTGTTTIDNGSDTATSPNECPSGSTEFEATGDISGGTGKAKSSIKKGWTYQAFVCVYSSGKVTLLKGTDMNIGKSY